ncbi:MAG: hypothetical protein QOI36_2218 [Pseudonocardiales bacterium]|nr:hypothetical protein [Pseudonocardiales bacterium]
MADEGLVARLRGVARDRVGPTEQSLIVAWGGFGATFGITRAITHWIRAGHGPAGGGMGARHLHHCRCRPHGVSSGVPTGMSFSAARGLT